MSQSDADPERGNAPDETSPLLQRIDPEHAGSIDPATDGTSAHIGDSVPPVEAPAGTRNYEGLPEVRKQLKYLFPALAIGVRSILHGIIWTGSIC